MKLSRNIPEGQRRTKDVMCLKVRRCRPWLCHMPPQVQNTELRPLTTAITSLEVTCDTRKLFQEKKFDRFEVRQKQEIMRNELGQTVERVACQRSREIRGPQESNTGEIKADWSSKGWEGVLAQAVGMGYRRFCAGFCAEHKR